MEMRKAPGNERYWEGWRTLMECGSRGVSQSYIDFKGIDIRKAKLGLPNAPFQVHKPGSLQKENFMETALPSPNLL